MTVARNGIANNSEERESSRAQRQASLLAGASEIDAAQRRNCRSLRESEPTHRPPRRLAYPVTGRIHTLDSG